MKIKLRDANHLNAILSQTVNLPIIQTKNEGYYVFSTDKDEAGNYRNGSGSYDKENAMVNIGDDDGIEKEDLDSIIKENDWHIVDWVIRCPEKMTHCRLIPNAKEICEKFGCDWDEKMKDMLKEEVLDVAEDTLNTVFLWQKDNSNGWVFPRQAVIPVIVENKPDISKENLINVSDEDLIAEVKKRGLVVNKKVIK